MIARIFIEDVLWGFLPVAIILIIIKIQMMTTKSRKNKDKK